MNLVIGGFSPGFIALNYKLFEIDELIFSTIQVNMFLKMSLATASLQA